MIFSFYLKQWFWYPSDSLTLNSSLFFQRGFTFYFKAFICENLFMKSNLNILIKHTFFRLKREKIFWGNKYLNIFNGQTFLHWFTRNSVLILKNEFLIHIHMFDDKRKIYLFINIQSYAVICLIIWHILQFIFTWFEKVISFELSFD